MKLQWITELCTKTVGRLSGFKFSPLLNVRSLWLCDLSRQVACARVNEGSWRCSIGCFGLFRAEIHIKLNITHTVHRLCKSNMSWEYCWSWINGPFSLLKAKYITDTTSPSKVWSCVGPQSRVRVHPASTIQADIIYISRFIKHVLLVYRPINIKESHIDYSSYYCCSVMKLVA